MFVPVSPTYTKLIYWVAAADVKKGQIIQNDSGAKPAAAAHATQTLVGVALEDTGTGAKVPMIPLSGEVFEIPFKSDATKTSCTVADIGTAFDISVSDGEMTLNLDDTTGGFCYLMDYNNDRMTARVMISNTLILVG